MFNSFLTSAPSQQAAAAAALFWSAETKKICFLAWRLCFHKGPASVLCFCENEWVRCQTTGSSFKREFSENALLFLFPWRVLWLAAGCSDKARLYCCFRLFVSLKKTSSERESSILAGGNGTVDWFLGSWFPVTKHGVRQHWGTLDFSSLAMITFQRNPGWTLDFACKLLSSVQ